MKRYQMTAVIWKEGKKYVSKCPELGVASYGSTPEKARAALEQAVELYISNAKKLGFLEDIKPLLSSQTRYTTPLEVALACGSPRFLQNKGTSKNASFVFMRC